MCYQDVCVWIRICILHSIHIVIMPVTIVTLYGKCTILYHSTLNMGLQIVLRWEYYSIYFVHEFIMKSRRFTIIILLRILKKIKGMPRSLFYDILCYLTMDYEKWFTSILLIQCEEIPAFEIQKSCQLHVDFTFQMWCWPCIFRIST